MDYVQNVKPARKHIGTLLKIVKLSMMPNITKISPKKKRLKYNQKSLAYQKANLPKYAAANARRHAEKMKATPKWVNHRVIEDFYRRASAWSKLSGEEWHVDHIVPIKSDAVCGLHCVANLRLLPAFKNLSKGNRWWPDMSEPEPLK